MKKLILPALLLCSSIAFSQKAVLLHRTNGTQQAFYANNPFAEAYNAAGHGDTIYLPGGYFGPVDIDKRLKIYGAGHYPDSTQATGTTIITGGMNIWSNADSTLVEGLWLQGGMSVQPDAVYVKIKRNRIEGQLNSSGNFGQFDGNVFVARIAGTGQPLTLLFTNNICQGDLVSFSNGAVFRNNIFLPQYNVLGGGPNTYVNFENNIFVSADPNWNYAGYSVYNTFTKNIFAGSPDFSNQTATGNYLNVSNIFVSQSGYIFSYSHNYHLQNPGNYPGTDATQCGIYGGLFVYKEGAVPANPHIISKTISATTDSQGKLNATIKVAAQNN